MANFNIADETKRVPNMWEIGTFLLTWIACEWDGQTQKESDTKGGPKFLFGKKIRSLNLDRKRINPFFFNGVTYV